MIAAFRRLREVDAAPAVGLVLRLARDGDEVVVGGTDPKIGEDYALDLLTWAAYLGQAVPDAVLNAFNAEEIIAHVLDEMTIYGATEESAADTLKKVLRLKPDRGGEGCGGEGPARRPRPWPATTDALLKASRSLSLAFRHAAIQDFDFRRSCTLAMSGTSIRPRKGAAVLTMVLTSGAV